VVATTTGPGPVGSSAVHAALKSEMHNDPAMIGTRPLPGIFNCRVSLSEL
jgi:hypothetical protein